MAVWADRKFRTGFCLAALLSAQSFGNQIGAAGRAASGRHITSVEINTAMLAGELGTRCAGVGMGEKSTMTARTVDTLARLVWTW